MAASFYYDPSINYLQIDGSLHTITAKLTNIISATFDVSGGALPFGLDFDNNTGNITGTPTFPSISPLTTYIINALNDANTILASTTVQILIDIVPEFYYINTPFVLANNNQYTGTDIIKPTYTFGNKVGTKYTSSPELSNIGLSINQDNGNIFGLTNTIINKQNYNITANNNNILYTTSITISVENVPYITYPNTIFNLTQGESVSIIPNQLTGNTSQVYSINCKLPTGLTLNSNTGEISGIPTVLTTVYEYTVRVSDIIGDAYRKIKLSVIKTELAPPVRSNASYEDAITNPAIQMRRKAEILQHKQNSSKLTKQQYLALLAKGNGPYSKRVWATQGDAFTSSNISGLPQSGSTIACNSQNRLIYKPTSSSDVPGPVVNLFLDPNVQPNGYTAPNRKRVDIGFKWPFSSGN